MKRRVASVRFAVTLVGITLAAASAASQPAGELPDAFDGIDVEEKFGASIPQDLRFQDSEGREITLGSLLDGETPLILNFVYHDCPMLCSIVLDALTSGMRDIAWLPGNEYEVLTVSFSASETPELAARKKTHYLDRLGRPDAASGWHFLVGDQQNIDSLTDAVGFRYKWDPDLAQFAHPAVLIFLDGNGKIMRYLYGIDFPALQLRSALIESSEGRIGNVVEKFIVSCYMYDPDAQSYTPDIMRIMRLAGGAFALLLLVGLILFWRREARSKPPSEAPPSEAVPNLRRDSTMKS